MASKAGIEAALKNLVTSIGPKDIVVIHFSSRGAVVSVKTTK